MNRPAKAAQVLRIVEQLRTQSPRWRMVVFTTRLETQAMLGRVLEAEGIRHGFIAGGGSAKNQRTLAAFRKDDPDINVIVSTDAGAEGVNLQIANILVNYDLPWNPMVVEQRIGRVQRIGSRFKAVYVANIVHADSPEKLIVARLMEKLQVIAHTVGDIEAVLEKAGDTEDASLDQRIRAMVINSLLGRDQEHAARMEAESIDQARKLIESQQEEMNHLLGAMNDGDRADVPMPRITPATPSMPLTEFVIAALSRDGCRFADDGTGLFRGQDAHAEPIQFTFDPGVLERHTQAGVFMGRAPQLYQPGKPAFERLVQRWIDRSAVHGEDRRCPGSEAEAVARGWIGGIPDATFLGCATNEARGAIAGRVLCRTRAANAVDSFEKILAVPVEAAPGAPARPGEAGASVDPRDVFPELGPLIEAHVAADRDIGQFVGFYRQRLDQELGKTDGGERRAKLVNDLSPSVTAETAAIDYTITGPAAVEVRYSIGGAGDYRSRIVVEGGVVHGEPRRQPCELSAALVPEDCLETCQVTGKVGLRHLMRRSDIGGGYAIPGKILSCALTGKQILETEAETCCMTGAIADRRALVRSAVSGRYVVPDRAAVCAVTQVPVVDDELLDSSISGKRFRRDEVVTLADGSSIAHRTEPTPCAFSGALLAPGDCATSSFSGKTMARTRLVRSALSGRECDPTELTPCAESGVRVLPDELVTCGSSGRAILESLTAICPETSIRASKSLFVECPETKDHVLPEGLRTCCVTGRTMRRSLLTASAASGKLALASAMVRCQATGALLLPAEVATSDISGKQVDRRCLRRCAATGTVGLKSELVKSDLTGVWILPEHARTLADGRVAGELEVALCEWTGAYLPRDGAAECRLCGVRLDKRLLNASGEFKTLRDILDGKQPGRAFSDPRYMARTFPDVFRGVSSCDVVSGPGSRAHILFATTSFFGLNRRVYALFVTGELSELRPLGKPLVGRRSSGLWSATQPADGS